MPTYLQHNPDGSKTPVKYRPIPKHIQRKMRKLSEKIQEVKKQIRWARRDGSSRQVLTILHNQVSGMEHKLDRINAHFLQNSPDGSKATRAGAKSDAHFSPPDQRPMADNSPFRFFSDTLAQVESRMSDVRDQRHQKTRTAPVHSGTRQSAPCPPLLPLQQDANCP